MHAVAFSPDGKRLASGSKDGVVMEWDIEKLLDKKNPRLPRGRQDLAADIKSVRPLPDSRTLLAVTQSGELVLIDLETPGRTARISLPKAPELLCATEFSRGVRWG